VFCDVYLAMLELEEMNESCGSSSEVYECKFFWTQLFIILCELELREKAVHGAEAITTDLQNMPTAEEQKMSDQAWRKTTNVVGEKKREKITHQIINEDLKCITVEFLIFFVIM
jgi:hypothetical protein